MENNHDNEIIINTTDDNKEKSLSEIQEKLKSTEYMNSIKGMSSTLSQLSKSLIDMHTSIMPNILKQNSELSTSLSKTAKMIADYQKTIMPDVIKNSIETSNKLSETIKSLVNSYDFNNLINIAVSSKLQNIMNGLSKTITSLHLGDLSGYETEYLNKRFWVIPYEYEYKNINSLTKLNKNDFEKKMIKHFTKSRINKIFSECIKNEEKKDKKQLLRQVKQNYFLGNYSICLTSLITYVDSLTLQLVDDNSTKQHTSHQVVNSLHEHYLSHDTYQMFLKIEVLKNFYDKLYKNDEQLKNPQSNIINRNLISHGSKYSNKQIDTLRIINAIWYIQSLIEETNLLNMFVYDNKSKQTKYKLKSKEMN